MFENKNNSLPPHTYLERCLILIFAGRELTKGWVFRRSAPGKRIPIGTNLELAVPDGTLLTIDGGGRAARERGIEPLCGLRGCRVQNECTLCDSVWARGGMADHGHAVNPTDGNAVTCEHQRWSW